MCGRYVSVASRSDLQTLFGVTSPSDVELPATWNVAPTQQIYAAITRPNKESGGTERRLEAMRWGLVPSWKSISRGPSPERAGRVARPVFVTAVPLAVAPFAGLALLRARRGGTFAPGG